MRFGDLGSTPTIAECYDCVPEHKQRSDIEFYAVLAGTRTHVLEIGCGTGRVLLELVRRGNTVIGIDLSQATLGRCRKKLQAESAEVRRRAALVCADMTNFTLATTVDLAVAPFRVLQNLHSLDELARCLRCVNAVLPVGGRFVFDVFNVSFDKLRQALRQPQQFPATTLPDGRIMNRWTCVQDVDEARQLITFGVTYEVVSADEQRTKLDHSFVYRYYTPSELIATLEQHGFGAVSICGRFDGSALQPESPELIVACQKER